MVVFTSFLSLLMVSGLYFLLSGPPKQELIISSMSQGEGSITHYKSALSKPPSHLSSSITLRGFIFLCCWELNPGPCAFYAGTPLSHSPRIIYYPVLKYAFGLPKIFCVPAIESNISPRNPGSLYWIMVCEFRDLDTSVLCCLCFWDLSGQSQFWPLTPTPVYLSIFMGQVIHSSTHIWALIEQVIPLCALPPTYLDLLMGQVIHSPTHIWALIEPVIPPWASHIYPLTPTPGPSHRMDMRCRYAHAQTHSVLFDVDNCFRAIL